MAVYARLRVLWMVVGRMESRSATNVLYVCIIMGGREGPVERGIAVDVSADPGTKFVVQTTNKKMFGGQGATINVQHDISELLPLVILAQWHIRGVHFQELSLVQIQFHIHRESPRRSTQSP